jgi:hypothetical protein
MEFRGGEIADIEHEKISDPDECGLDKSQLGGGCPGFSIKYGCRRLAAASAGLNEVALLY